MSGLETYLFSEHESIISEGYGWPQECDSCGDSVDYTVTVVGNTEIGDILGLEKETDPTVEWPCPEHNNLCEVCIEHAIAAKELDNE